MESIHWSKENMLILCLRSRIDLYSIIIRHTPGASFSKLTTSLVNGSLKFQMAILQIWYIVIFLLKKCENPSSHFFNKKIKSTKNKNSVLAFDVNIYLTN